MEILSVSCRRMPPAGAAAVLLAAMPPVTVAADGELDFSRAYAVGVGAWDVHTIRYGYSQFAPAVDEASALAEIVRQGLAAGLLFLSDEDARPPGASEPRANLWDNGDDPVAGLEMALRVRRIALGRFGERQVLPGTPLAELDLPEAVLELLAPRPFEYPRHRELLASSTAPAFDALGAARSAADQVLLAVLQPERLGRVADFHRRHPELPDTGEILATVTAAAFPEGTEESVRHAALRQVVQRALVDRLIAVAASAGVRPRLRARLEQALGHIQSRLKAATAAHGIALAADVRRFLERGQGDAEPLTGPPAEPPPGAPIGSPPDLAACSWLG